MEIVAPDINLLRRLQDWYSSQCDGGWEHQHGISIGTLDNPGWTFRVDLTDTELVDHKFDEIRVERSNDEWFLCRVKDRTFEGFSGPKGLGDLIAAFLNWADASSRPK